MVNLVKLRKQANEPQLGLTVGVLEVKTKADRQSYRHFSVFCQQYCLSTI